jgi:serine/threonine-protein kinase
MFGMLASGGMATVHLGRLTGAAGFSRTVAIKAMRPQYVEDRDFVSMFIDEARLAARIRHPNVVPTLDVIQQGDELFLVMEYVHGETLSRLLRKSADMNAPVPIAVAAAIVRDVLLGLHAAHEAVDEKGRPLGVVHRDVSPQNVIVGTDGVARVLDFGVAKASGRTHTTRDGQIKGKLAYMSPEQLHGTVTRAADVFAASVLLWETLAGERLFGGNSEGEVVTKILGGKIPRPGERRPGLGPELEEVVMKGLAPDPADRYATARDMAAALLRCCPPADPTAVGDWVRGLAAETLADRSQWIREMETSPSGPSTSTSSDKLQAASAGRPAAAPPVPPDQNTRTDLSGEASRVSPSTGVLRWAIGIGAAAAAALLVALVVARGPSGPAAPAPAPSAAAAPTASTPVVVTGPSSDEAPAPPPSASAAASAAGTSTRGVPSAGQRPAPARPPPSSKPTTSKPGPAQPPDHI